MVQSPGYAGTVKGKWLPVKRVKKIGGHTYDLQLTVNQCPEFCWLTGWTVLPPPGRVIINQGKQVNLQQ